MRVREMQSLSGDRKNTEVYELVGYFRADICGTDIVTIDKS